MKDDMCVWQPMGALWRAPEVRQPISIVSSCSEEAGLLDMGKMSDPSVGSVQEARPHCSDFLQLKLSSQGKVMLSSGEGKALFPKGDLPPHLSSQCEARAIRSSSVCVDYQRKINTILFYFRDLGLVFESFRFDIIFRENLL